MPTYSLTVEDISPLLEGLAILGTGGGGSPHWGRALLEKEFSEGREVSIIDSGEIADDSLVVCGGIMGSVKALEGISINELMAKWEQRFELVEAARVMQKYLGRNVDYAIPFEVGGLNTPVIMAMASRMGIRTVDGDALGRSAPETQMTSFLAHGVSLTPMTLTDTYGNTIIVAEQNRSVFADEIGRWMVTRGGGMGANNHYPMNGLTVKKVAIPNSVSMALDIGRKLLAARDKHENPVDAVAKAMQAVYLFEGVINDIRGEDKGGFYVTNISIAGDNKYKGQSARMVIKNETMALWIDGSLKVIFPDLVCMLDPESGEGIMSVDLEKGKPLSLLGAPCHPRLRESLQSPAAVEAFGGARYGHPEISFVPMEELI